MKSASGLVSLATFGCLVLTLTQGCVSTPVPRYDVHHAALVAPPAPPMWSGKTRDTGFTMGNSSVLWNNSPKASPESASGLYVASTQFDGNIHIDLGPSGQLALWVPLSYGMADYSFAAKPCLVDRPDSGTFSGGLGTAFSFDILGPWYAGVALETVLSYVPARVTATCVENCGFASDLRTDKSTSTVVPVVRFTLATGVDFEWIRLFAGMAFRNHPWNTEQETISTTNPDDIDDTVTFGKAYVLLGVGVEVELGDHVGLLAQIYQPFAMNPFPSDGTRDTVEYGPIMGVTLDLHFPRG